MYYIPDCNDNNESSRLVNITQVKRNNSEVLYGGPQETAQTGKLSYKQNQIMFRFFNILVIQYINILR